MRLRRRGGPPDGVPRCPEGSGGALAGGLDDIYESSGVLLTVKYGF